MIGRIPPLVLGIGAFLVLFGCASTGHVARDNSDPLEGYNRFMFTVNDKLDKAVIKPVAQAYQTVTPEPIDQGISNFFGNLGDVVVVFNDLLQIKFEQAAMDTSRVVFNTTFGLLGFIDVASHMDLPKHNEDFGQTLGYWGVGEGYYLVLPFFGPSTTRDAPGLVVDSFADPVGYITPVRARNVARGTRIVDGRADFLQVERALGEEAQIDPYVFRREAYLQRRRNMVYDGNPPPINFDDEAPEAEPKTAPPQ